MHVVVKPFPYSENGVKVEEIAVGQKRDFGALTQGLLDAKLIAPEGTKLAGGSVPKSPNTPPAGGDEPLVLPEGWRELHHNILIPLAQKLDDSVAKKAEAIAVLENHELDEAARRAASAGPDSSGAGENQS